MTHTHRFAALTLTALLGLTRADAQAADPMKPPPGMIPRFEVDSTWFKALPPAWTWWRPTEPQSDVLGINANRANDHVWVTTHSQIAEYDPMGNLLKTLPRPEGPYTTIHGMYLDYKGFLWTTAREEHQVLKLTQDGKVVFAIGENKVNKGSNDTTTMGRPAEIYVDRQTNEVYVADGYTNHRVIVFSSETGKFLRYWGAYGKPPVDGGARVRVAADSFATVPQFNIPHGITGSRDGLIYVSDRENSRVQVFKRNGEFVQEAFTRKGTGGAFSVALSPDPDETFVYVTDGTGHRIWIFRRKTMEVVGSFSKMGKAAGEVGRPHNITVDSKGNIFLAEADPGRRAQKFVFKGWITPPK